MYAIVIGDDKENNSMKDFPFISVIVPVYNAQGTIKSCIESLEKQSIPGEQYEIILVNDGSVDRSDEIIKYFNARVFSQKNAGR